MPEATTKPRGLILPGGRFEWPSEYMKTLAVSAGKMADALRAEKGARE